MLSNMFFGKITVLTLVVISVEFFINIKFVNFVQIAVYKVNKMYFLQNKRIVKKNRGVQTVQTRMITKSMKKKQK